VGQQTYDVSFTVTFFASQSETGQPLGSALGVAPGQTVTEDLSSTDPDFSQSNFYYQFQVDTELPSGLRQSAG
jgi:hypothetical protein